MTDVESVAEWIKRAALTDPRGDNALAQALGVSASEIRAVREAAAAERERHIVRRGFGGPPIASSEPRDLTVAATRMESARRPLTLRT